MSGKDGRGKWLEEDDEGAEGWTVGMRANEGRWMKHNLFNWY